MRTRVVIRAWLCALPLHIGTPFGLAWVHARAGLDAVHLTVAGLHLAFPVLYMFCQVLAHLCAAELLLLLLLNHLVMFSVGGWLMWLR